MTSSGRSKGLRAGLLRWTGHIRVNWPWVLYQRFGVNNLVTNRFLRPIEFAGASSCDIDVAEYERLLSFDVMQRFRKYDFVFDKVLEYCASLKLLSLNRESVLLDAAGGCGEFAALAAEMYSPQKVYCLDLVASRDRGNSVLRLHGKVSSIPLPDESVTAISCHHSFEHFKGDADINFVRELSRILKPGGKACIVPIFLCNRYAEIWNMWPPGKKYDRNAVRLYDPLGTFPGWGKGERFARVYDLTAFKERIVQTLPDTLGFNIHEIFYQSRPCPDIKKNRHQPKLNGSMKALVLTKNISEETQPCMFPR